MKAWFGFPEEADCLSIKMGPLKGQAQFWSVEKKSNRNNSLGNFTFDEGHYRVAVEGIGALFLPPEQQVFETSGPLGGFRMVFFQINTDLGGTFQRNQESPRPFYLKLEPNGYQLLAQKENKIVSLLSYRNGCISIPQGHVCPGL